MALASLPKSFADYMYDYEDDDAQATRENLTKRYAELVGADVDEDGKPRFPYLQAYTAPVKLPERPIVGRDAEMDRLMAAMMRPELCNVILLAEAGTGKTALVQGTMMRDTSRLYLEVDLSKMISDLQDANQMADRLKQLFNETEVFRKEKDIEIVLFMDEFHQVVQLSSAAVEALKPLLADSGTRGIRVIAATTFIEFRKWIQPNQPLVERLQRINLDPPDRKMTVQILKGMAKRYGVENQFYNDHIFEQIYDYTNRYIPANSQPRKSILVLDSMVGWYRFKKRKINMRLLADVIYESEGVNIAFRVDATKIKEELDKYVIAQGFATSVIEQRLQVCVADLNNKSKPMSSFLFTGSTGVGKGLTNDTVVPVYTKDGSIVEKLNGDLQVGDYVFNRLGQPVQVIGVFPRGKQDIYKVSLSDGRCLYTDSSHLWTYLEARGQGGNTYTNSTKELYTRGVYTIGKDGKHKLKYYVPMNHAVVYPEKTFKVHPYVMGAFIGSGCMTVTQLMLSEKDESVVARVADLLGGCSYKSYLQRPSNWVFPLIGDSVGNRCKQLSEVFGAYPEVCGKTAGNKRVPKEYFYGSVEQRWELIRGLFDTVGVVGADGRYNISYSSTSVGLLEDIRTILYSLGIESVVSISRHIENNSSKGDYTQYKLSVKVGNESKEYFFWSESKRSVASKAKTAVSHDKKYEWVGIEDIELMPEQKETTCIYVDDEEHLYQAGQYVVTHNTEVTKQLARILFQDVHRLIRFDMTEYANPDSLDSFRRELTNRVWERPYSIILLDEIEKACAPVTRILLQVLDDGRLMDENNREVTFTNAYIVMTTNAGSEVYEDIAQYEASDTGAGQSLHKYEKLIRDSISSTTGDNKFPPELLGRIDCIVPFQPLSLNTQMKIVRNKLTDLSIAVREKHGIELQIKKRVLDYIVRDNLDTEASSGGARAAISKMESEVVTEVARHINRHPEDTSIVVDVEGAMAWENKSMLESTAHIVIRRLVSQAR